MILPRKPARRLPGHRQNPLARARPQVGAILRLRFGAGGRESPAGNRQGREVSMKKVVMLVAVLAFARVAAGAERRRLSRRLENGQRRGPHLRILDSRRDGQGHLLHLLRRCDDAGVRRWDVRTRRHQVRGHPCEGGRQHGVQGQGASRSSAQGRLIVTGTSGAPGGGKFERVLIKDPRGPDPIPVMVSVLPKASVRCRRIRLVGTPTAQTACPTSSRVRGSRS